MLDMKTHDLQGISQCGLPLYVLSIGRTVEQREWSDGVTEETANHCCVNFCISGRGRMRLFDREYPFNSGDVIWHLPREANTVSFAGPHSEYIFVAFAGPLAEAILLSYRYPRRQTGADVQRLNKTFQEIAEKIGETSIACRRELAALLVRFLGEIGGSPDSERLTTSGHFLKIIHEEYADPRLDLNVICERLHCSLRTLYRVVQRELHQKPGLCLLQHRIMHAHYLLRNTEMSVREVAAACGFQSENYFCRLIRKVSGCSPLEYRRRERAAKDSGRKTPNDGENACE